jgi:hypothetical protein
MLMLSRLYLSRFAIPIIAIATFVLFGFLWLYHESSYFRLLFLIMKLPAPHPFIDWEWLPAAVRCWSEGVNVYLQNTCSQVTPYLAYNYSPLWLRATFLRSIETWNYTAGFVIGVLFFLSLASMPTPRNARDQTIMLLATLSSATFLAVERGNADLIMFLMVIAGVNLCFLRLPFRLLGYGLIILAGLLKFYPFIALIIALREKTRVFLMVAIASVASLAVLVVAYHQELEYVARNLPIASYFSLQFGLANLPKGLGIAITWVLRATMHMRPDEARDIGAMVASILLPIFLVVEAVATITLIRQTRLFSALPRLTPRQLGFFVPGAALICGCFLVGGSVIYRGIFLLLTLPALAAASHDLPTRRARKAFEGAFVAIVFVLWTPFIESYLFILGLHQPVAYPSDTYDEFPASPAGFLIWISSELAWWWIITVLISVVTVFVMKMEACQTLCRLLRIPTFGGRFEPFPPARTG